MCVCVLCVVEVEIFQNAMFDDQRLLAITNLYSTKNCYPIVIPLMSSHPFIPDLMDWLAMSLAGHEELKAGFVGDFKVTTL